MPAPHSKSRRTRDTATLKRVSHQKDPRVQEAAAQVQEDQRRLQARIAYEQSLTVVSLLRTASAVERLTPPQSARLAQAEKERDYQAHQEELRERYPYGEARALVREGYSVTHVQRRTGWPADMLADVVAGEW